MIAIQKIQQSQKRMHLNRKGLSSPVFLLTQVMQLEVSGLLYNSAYQKIFLTF